MLHHGGADAVPQFFAAIIGRTHDPAQSAHSRNQFSFKIFCIGSGNQIAGGDLLDHKMTVSAIHQPGGKIIVITFLPLIERGGNAQVAVRDKFTLIHIPEEKTFRFNGLRDRSNIVHQIDHP